MKTKRMAEETLAHEMQTNNKKKTLALNHLGIAIVVRAMDFG